DEAGIERASLCGVSIGGMASLWVAATAPERVDRLILCCTSAHPGAPEVWARRAATVRTDGMEAVADVVVRRWFPHAWAERHREVVDALRASLVAIPPEGYAAACEALIGLDLRPFLPRVRAATMIIAGAQDPAFPVSHARELADGISGSRPVIIAAAAHLANVQCPREVADLMSDHLAAVPRTRPDA
ncbi:MAG TPA: alpha/beta fold hydrolase, partial [Candidatus Sulfotelmatobacter sp.]|nr:alpha/beta fold hydrolase [Candidatus Sulfotelmatobacter sp.]